MCVLCSLTKPATWWDPAQSLNEYQNQSECAGTTNLLPVKVSELLLLRDETTVLLGHSVSECCGSKSQAHRQLALHL